MYRQGDVLLIPCAEPPKDGRVKRPRDANGRLVLALGEATGHAHAIASPKADLFEVAGATYLLVDGDCVTLDHEEHTPPIALPPQWYRVPLQREYHPETIRRVSD